MPIVRRSFSFEGQFTQIPNAWLRDTRLSLRAKGLLGQLLTHSDGWSVTVKSLAVANSCGRDAIRTAVKELEEAGYLTRRQDRAEGGEFAETIWETSEPMTGSPLPDYPSPVIPPLKNTNSKNNNLKNLALFDKFWELYPRKVGKASARKAFEKHVDEAFAILGGVERLANDKNLPPTQFIPYPATWINRQGWDDEPYPDREPAPGEARGYAKPADLPERRAWVRALHNDGDHWECRPGEFGCK